MNGPFLIERAICLPYLASTYPLFSSANDHLVRSFVVSGLVTASRLSPRSYRITTAGCITFTAAVRMIHGVHRNAANVRTNSTPSRASGFTERDVFVLDIANLTNRRHTVDDHATNFARRQAQLRVIAFLRNQLGRRTGAANHLSAFTRSQLDIVNLRAERNVTKRKRISDDDVSFGSGNHSLSD